MSEGQVVLYEKRDQVVIITLNRPHRNNTFTLEMFDQCAEAWRKFEQDREARVAIITGAGDKAFSTGMDLKAQAERVAKDPSFDIVKLRPGVLMGTEGMPSGNGVTKPVIAAINGTATASGFMIAMQCDIRVAAETARFGISEAKVGRGSPWAAPAITQVPSPILTEIILTADLMPAQRLYEVGWINRIVPQDKLMSTALEIAASIAANAPLSVKCGKAMMDRLPGKMLGDALEMAKEIYRPVYESQDAIEGPRAFAEKRKPVWQGK